MGGALEESGGEGGPPQAPPKCTYNHVCMSFSCPGQNFSARLRRGLALLTGVFLVQ